MKATRMLHSFVCGKKGWAVKTLIVKEEEFRQEWVPQNAVITTMKIEGENYVRIEYGG